MAEAISGRLVCYFTRYCTYARTMMCKEGLASWIACHGSSLELRHMALIVNNVLCRGPDAQLFSSGSSAQM